MPERKIVDETHKIADKRGNGQLRREIWVDDETDKVVRYNLAYVNYNIYKKDNGRVLGYDNTSHGHCRHLFGQIDSIEFSNFEDIESRFESDWIVLRKVK